MPVCGECETSVDEFSLLSKRIIHTGIEHEAISHIENIYRRSRHDRVSNYRIRSQEAAALKAALETRLFQEYNDLRINTRKELERFNLLLASIANSSRTGEQFHILDIYHFLGMRREYQKIFSKVLLNAVVASDVELETGHWKLEGEFAIFPLDGHTDDTYRSQLLHANLSSPQAAHFHRNPPKDLMNSIQEIVAIAVDISHGHHTNWKENQITNHPGGLENLPVVALDEIREVKEYCPACGSLEWQGIHVHAEAHFDGIELETEVDDNIFVYDGRITEMNEQFLADIVRAGQQHLDHLQKRIKAFEKFNKGIEKKVKRRLKKRADDKKKAEIKALKAKLRELEEE